MARNKSPAADPDWLQPVSDVEPCGPNLEYDQEYAVLLARFAPKAEAQYGKFVDKPEPPDWADVERDCRRLMLRSKDISVLVWLARCRTRLGGATGLRDVLTMLAHTLQRFPDHIHPQRVIEGEDDPAVRANALAALADPQGLLSDIRDIVVSANTAFRLTVKDVERANAIPRPVDAMPSDAVAQQLDHLRAQGQPQVTALSEAAFLLKEIDAWSQQHLQDEAPAITVVTKLLALFTEESAPDPGATFQPAPTLPAAMVHPPIDATPSTAPRTIAANGTVSSLVTPAGSTAEQREHVRAHIRIAKEWLDHNEPSSPVAILLKQAEKLLGKRFAEVAHAIPAELLAKWDQEM